MKNLLHICGLGLLAALAGCATYPSSPGYANGGYAQPSDPSQWRVVSVTPVAPGTGDKVAAASPNGSRVEYSSRPVSVQPVYTAAPVFMQQPVYVPAPVYIEEPLWYPPISLSLGFGFGRSWGHHGFGRAHVGTGWGHGYGRRGGRHR